VNATCIGLLVNVRNIYMFVITISALDLKRSLLKPVRFVVSGLLMMQTMLLVLFAVINSMLKFLCSGDI